MELVRSVGRNIDRRTLAESLRLGLYTITLLSVWIIQISQREFLDFHTQTELGIIFLLSLGLHVYLQIKETSKLQKLIPFVDQAVISALSVVYLSYHPGFMLVTVFNLLITAYQYGPSVGFKLGLYSIALFNFSFLVLYSYGIEVPMISHLIFSSGLFVSALISGGLSSELQSLEEDLREKSEDLSALKDLSDLLIDNMGAGLLAISKKGKIIKANIGASRIFESIGLLGQHLSDLSDPMWAYVSHADRTETYELDHQSVKGLPMVLEVVVSPIRIQKEYENGWVVVIQNRTEIKNLESELRQKDKLAAVGQLAAGIAHEIRNPLASISGSVQLLAGTLDTATSDDKKLLAIIIKEIDRLNDLITEFLEYVRPESQEHEKIILSDLVSEVLASIKNNKSLPLGVYVETDYQSKGLVLGNRDKLKQALLNIFINAYQAMEKSTTKTLKVLMVEKDGDVILSIEDSGLGIPKDHLRRIFEPFHTTKPKGTGLGLAIAHKVIESCGASIGVASQVNVGTRFDLRFPGNKV